MNGRFKYLFGSQGIDISAGQRWIRRHNVLKINNPLNIEVVAEPDEAEERFYIKDLAHDVYLFFYRDDIVNNYERKTFDGDMDFNEQICEIKGWRYSQDADGDLYLTSEKGKKEVVDYLGNPMLCDKLLASLSKYKPKFKIGMGKYTLYLERPYHGTTREEVICAAWIDKNS